MNIVKQHFQSGVEMIRRDLVTGQWAPYLKKAINMKPCYEGAVNGGEVSFIILCFFIYFLTSYYSTPPCII